MNLSILTEADAETFEAALWYEDQKPGLGEEFLTERGRVLRSIEANPLAAARLEYYTGSHDIRRAIMRRFPFAVVYLCRESEAIVVALAHLHRRPLYWINRIGSE